MEDNKRQRPSFTTQSQLQLHGRGMTVLPLVTLRQRLQLQSCRKSVLQQMLSHQSSIPIGTMSWAKALFFRKVYAESQDETLSGKSKSIPDKTVGPLVADNSAVSDLDKTSSVIPEGEEERIAFFEMLTRLRIENESGNDRIGRILRKDHRGYSSPEMAIFKQTMIQVMAISFFIKYVPTWFHEKNEFIKGNKATVFRTKLEAARLLQDHATYQAGKEAALFTTKLTTFCGSFLIISQYISSYNNRSSFTDYSIAGGLTGGFARLSMGPKGFVSGSIVGSALGTLFGSMAVEIMRYFRVTTEDRHYLATFERMQVEKSILGEENFNQMVKEMLDPDRVKDPEKTSKHNILL